MTNVVTGGERRCFDFSKSDYRQLLSEFRDLGYRAAGPSQIDASKAHLFLRHDVDLCLERALEIATIEAEEGFTATYYILVSTDAYNPASSRSRAIMRRLSDLGHAIGLHFDVTALAGGSDDIHQSAATECDVLQHLSGAPVESLSFHRPAPALLGFQGRIAGRPHTYEPRFTKEIGYVSDSSGGFFHGHPLDHPAVKERLALQLLTHPIWWASDARASADDAMNSLRQERAATSDRIFAAATAKAGSRGKALA